MLSGVATSIGDQIKDKLDFLYVLETLATDLVNLKKGKKKLKTRARLLGAAVSGVIGGLIPTWIPKYYDYAQPIVEDVFGNAFSGNPVASNSTGIATDAAASGGSTDKVNFPIIYDILVIIFTIYILMYINAHATKELIRLYHKKTLGVTNPENHALSEFSLARLTSPDNNLKFTRESAEEYHKRMVDYMLLLKEEKQPEMAKFVKRALTSFRTGDAVAAFRFIVALGALHQVDAAVNKDLTNQYNLTNGAMDLNAKNTKVSGVIKFVNAHEAFLKLYQFAVNAKENKKKRYDFGLGTDTNRFPRVIYLEASAAGLIYEVVNYFYGNADIKRNTIHWHSLPASFPRTVDEIILQKDTTLPLVLEYTTRAHHTPPLGGIEESELKQTLQDMFDNVFIMLAYEIAELSGTPEISQGSCEVLEPEKAKELLHGAHVLGTIREFNDMPEDQRLDALESGEMRHRLLEAKDDEHHQLISGSPGITRTETIKTPEPGRKNSNSPVETDVLEGGSAMLSHLMHVRGDVEMTRTPPASTPLPTRSITEVTPIRLPQDERSSDGILIERKRRESGGTSSFIRTLLTDSASPQTPGRLPQESSGGSQFALSYGQRRKFEKVLESIKGASSEKNNKANAIPLDIQAISLLNSALQKKMLILSGTGFGTPQEPGSPRSTTIKKRSSFEGVLSGSPGISARSKKSITDLTKSAPAVTFFSSSSSPVATPVPSNSKSNTHSTGTTVTGVPADSKTDIPPPLKGISITNMILGMK